MLSPFTGRQYPNVLHEKFLFYRGLYQVRIYVANLLLYFSLPFLVYLGYYPISPKCSVLDSPLSIE